MNDYFDQSEGISNIRVGKTNTEVSAPVKAVVLSFKESCMLNVRIFGGANLITRIDQKLGKSQIKAPSRGPGTEL